MRPRDHVKRYHLLYFLNTKVVFSSEHYQLHFMMCDFRNAIKKCSARIEDYLRIKYHFPHLSDTIDLIVDNIKETIQELNLFLCGERLSSKINGMMCRLREDREALNLLLFYESKNLKFEE
ncbi:unnamed protein product [Ceutorhynchus assimilis]|uniref:Uncharacterized protein n=1 Tax=Ceutorhynchus assimilis TaxID=467358 RepID=A0A9N9QMH0_9CUCU|nr:unnamed protein product [Ceutorhynchus assimilis]